MNDNSHSLSLADDIVASAVLASLCGIVGRSNSLTNLSLGNSVNNINLTQQNALSNQQASNQLSLAAVGSLVDLVASTNFVDESKTANLTSGDDSFSERLTDLSSIGQFRMADPAQSDDTFMEQVADLEEALAELEQTAPTSLTVRIQVVKPLQGEGSMSNSFID